MYQALFFFPSRAKETKKQKIIIIIIITPDLRFSVGLLLFCSVLLHFRSGLVVSLLVLTIYFILGFLLLSNANSFLLILILSDNS